MVAGESFAYLKPYFWIILTDYWMPMAWYGGLALVTLMAALYGAARALGLAGMGRRGASLGSHLSRRGGRYRPGDSHDAPGGTALCGGSRFRQGLRSC